MGASSGSSVQTCVTRALAMPKPSGGSLARYAGIAAKGHWAAYNNGESQKVDLNWVGNYIDSDRDTSHDGTAGNNGDLDSDGYTNIEEYINSL